MNSSPVLNSLSLSTLRSIRNNQNNLFSSLEKLSSGKRINRASDDAAGLTILENLKSETKALEQASRNIDYGTSLLQTAEGGLNEMGDLLGRAHELAVQAANGTYSSRQRESLNNELQAIKSEIDRLSSSSEFNGKQLLDGEFSPTSPEVDVQAGTNDSPESRIALNVIEDTSTASLGIDTADISTPGNALSAVESIQAAIATVSNTRGQIGALENRLESAYQNNSVSFENLKTTESRIGDTDYALESARLAKNTQLFQASLKVLSYTNAQESTAGVLLNALG
jgi:flagellin